MPAVSAREGAAAVPAYRREAAFLVIVGTAIGFAALGHHRLAGAAGTWLGALMFAWLFVVIILGAMSVVRHADRVQREGHAGARAGDEHVRQPIRMD